ncbi:1,3-beta-glucan synthase component GLS2 [Metschnikowia bicuspidata var. bicuspidata NRRL YB-4993]|uniref:1,3-beta-glucan synthase n=1 Tax=Metschnikowia bicuspidata var. bicuspidata NRRL YB-4993 TaxID=869754 RepID=A0A1A0HCJ6_9ASCO|nr:1,3-beta-glucan synthase component GLS2 [Metschnikowia bicuspidata var. bicuspidata NRRL YB-4993]OBA21715.1 1,3-beta-glucan synthase component GLS2 [Metschnikowia bicuspidata var. bicuspidata NRRL YB-4993]
MFLSPKHIQARSAAPLHTSHSDLAPVETQAALSVAEVLHGENTPFFINLSYLSEPRKSEPQDDSDEEKCRSEPKKIGSIHWGPPETVPILEEDIGVIFSRLQMTFCFQHDNMKNMMSYFLTLLESRASRSGPYMALRTLHADYIGGPRSNFRKWYFAAEMDVDDLPRKYEKKHKRKASQVTESLLFAQKQWQMKMARLSPEEQVTHVALYLLIWGEANNIRFMPECLCFLFKCCIDYYSTLTDYGDFQKYTHGFLDHAITPLYMCLRQQLYEEKSAKLEKVDKDHDLIVGYDDMNQTFWHRTSLQRIMLSDHTSIMDLQKEERFKALAEVDWLKAFCKTYRETRTWMHIVVNFNRVIIIHLSVFWYYTIIHSYPLYTPGYEISYNNRPTTQTRLSIMSLAGALLVSISLFALILEFRFLPRRWEGSHPISKRFWCLSILLFLNTAPTIIVHALDYQDFGNSTGISIATCHFVFSIFTVLYLSIVPPIRTFGCKLKGRAQLASESFTSNFHILNGEDKTASIGLWVMVFSSKFLESYLFLTLPMRHPVRELSVMKTNCLGDMWLGQIACRYQPKIVLLLIFVLEFILFFLDTYLWYVVWTAVFSVARCYYLGSSIWTPWNNIYSRLPKRIYSKLLVTTGIKTSDETYMVSKIWNAIVVSMYREHYISIEQVQKLIYHQILERGTSTIINEPSFFVSQEDESLRLKIFSESTEAQRRISFFAQSLTSSIPEAREIQSMPSFTVFIPHYSEKIILLLKEIIREEDKYAQVTLLEYLKQLYSLEWVNFVRDTKLMAEEYECKGSQVSTARDNKEDNAYDLIGFREATPTFTMRTRIWASLRSQTLYRTVFGFMNYSKSIKMLLDLETEEDIEYKGIDNERLQEIQNLTLRKFFITVSMQRFKDFTEEEHESAEVLLRAYPELQIAYIEEEASPIDGSLTFYSCLIDGSCPKNAFDRRIPKYRIRISGYPILGDGKSDNQNHSVIFTRGEYIQLVDANQDNYIEECLKIRNILAEFEEQNLIDPYSSEYEKMEIPDPVAIIGTREYIFSENTGILGDIAAGKEQTFGTLFARTLAQIGGKLHYGHPDFLNGIFMTTRGGVSKAQRGLHLNEDIYAGMTAVARGGRIKHCEYMQCGKGRDLGFTSILNFITKIGTGMGEQNLSREYFYLGTQLPLDRMLSFYYAHVGFHLNNFLIILSIQIFLLIGINLASLTSESMVCKYHESRPITDPREPEFCANLIPVIGWLERCILSIFLVFFMSMLPLTVYELSERGVYKSITRIGKHMFSMSPLFEIFVCKIYSQSLVRDITIGGAQYIATGRGFATRREAFSDLYTRFGNESLTFGAFLFLLVVYFSTSMWKPVFAFFWIVVLGLIISPFIFNPNQFVWNEFFADYLQFFKWLHSGNSEVCKSSWATYTKIGRSRYTGVKVNYGKEEEGLMNQVRPSRFNIITTVIFPQSMVLFFILTAYFFSNSQNESSLETPSYILARVLFVAMLPIGVNMVIMIFVFITSLCFGSIISSFMSQYPSFVAAIIHTLSIAAHLFSVLLLFVLQNFDVEQTVLGFCLVTMVQKVTFQVTNTLFMSREVLDSRSNRAWWSGKWLSAGLGWRTLSQPFREYICKVSEQSYFAADFMVSHMIFYAQLPAIVIPLSNTFHSMMLMWLKPGSQLRLQFYSKKEKKRRIMAIYWSTLTFFSVAAILTALIVVPVLCVMNNWFNIEDYYPQFFIDMMQPDPFKLVPTGLRKDLSLGS